MRIEATYLGSVRRVVGAKILVEVSHEIPSASPIINGKVYRLGQIGSFVKIPLGLLNIYGVVSMVGASELINTDSIELNLPSGQRWIEVQLIGESYGIAKFQRGITTFPTIDDEVHIVTEEELSTIYGTSSPSMIEVGTYAASESLQAKVDLDKVITRHAAIIGSTGSGKSNAVAKLLRSIVNSSFPSARVLVIDPHGEYSSALQDQARIFSIGDKDWPLIIPYWALSFDELAWFFVDRRSSSETVQDTILRDRITSSKKIFCGKLKAGAVNENEITADSPIPFDLKDIWFSLYINEHATLRRKDDWGSIAYKKDESGNEIKGDEEKIILPQFEPPGAGSSPPFRSTRAAGLAPYLNKLLGRFKDRRFDFLINPGEYDGCEKDLHDLLKSWVEHEHSITVFDLGGVPFEVIDLVVGVVTRILFESMFWGSDLPGTGRQRPILIVYEEAHTYLPRGGDGQFIAGYSGRAVRRIFKEGRKYGVGAIVVSQRPSELDETILSQCGTYFALRLSNSGDQGIIRATVPDSLVGLIDLLPALRTGEALVLGEAVQIPSRIRFPLVEPRPKSDDPEPSKCWSEKRIDSTPYEKAITQWRLQQKYE